MRTNLKWLKLISCVLLSLFCLVGCKKEVKQGKVKVSDYNYVIRPDSTHLLEVDAEGTVKNVGPYDVKNIVVSGYCISCQQKMISGQWFDSADVGKTTEQKAIISYLTPGQEAPFKFKSIAAFLHKSGVENVELPKKMEVRVVSFETVQ